MSQRKTGWAIQFLRYGPLTIAALALVVVAFPGGRQFLSETFSPEFRTVLSTASGNVMGSSEEEKVVKVKTEQGLFVEVYSSELSLIQRIALDHGKDGYFMFDGEASNLVLDDIDGDRTVEILVPTYDRNLVAHLNIYSFSKSRQVFVKLN